MTETMILAGPGTMNAPWGLDSRARLVELACEFFDPSKSAENLAAIDQKPTPGNSAHFFDVIEFLEYLRRRQIFRRPPSVFRVAQVLERMTSAGLLTRILAPDAPSITGIAPGRYMLTGGDAHRGQFRFASVLGPEYLYRLCVPTLVHIAGTSKTSKGSPASGTGLVVDEQHILTCRHVVSDMELDRRQVFQDREYEVTDRSIHEHAEMDVAVMRVDGPRLAPVPGFLLQAPVVGQTVYTLGYPKLPGLLEASVTMQPGAVTNESVTSLAGERLFLYSAIARPGNSGGPVVSEDGYCVGLSTVDATGQYVGENAFSPHYAGIPAQVLVAALDDLGLRLLLEQYE